MIALQFGPQPITNFNYVFALSSQLVSLLFELRGVVAAANFVCEGIEQCLSLFLTQ